MRYSDKRKLVFSLVLSCLVGIVMSNVPAYAQPPISTSGALIAVPAYGEVRAINDEAHLTFAVEEQDKDKATAASRVNLRMKQGIELIKRQDSLATLQSRGYYTYAVYADQPDGKMQRNRQPIAWRVGQYLDVTTASLPTLPVTVAAAQRVLTLNDLGFGLARATAKKLEDKRIAATWQNLNERMGSIAGAMGRAVGDATVENVDFDGAVGQPVEAMIGKMAMRASTVGQPPIEEPVFEPGETVLQMRLVAKVRFK
jgi:uncharacterized protein YggE